MQTMLVLYIDNFFNFFKHLVGILLTYVQLMSIILNDVCIPKIIFLSWDSPAKRDSSFSDYFRFSVTILDLAITRRRT